MHRRLVALVLFLALIPLPALAGPLGLPTEAILGGGPAPADTLKVGVGQADMTWHVGAGAGQYSDKGAPGPDAHMHSALQTDSYGVQSRLSTRAIVVEGTNGQRVALVKTDNYLAQDLLIRRVGQILQAQGSTLDHTKILHAATHNHSSPYYSSPAVGVWVFQDVWDIRAFEYQARQIALAISNAEAAMKPAQMGATTVYANDLKANIAGRRITRDGSPAGYPDTFGDDGVVVIRFDEVLADGRTQPLATWMNYGQHPESLDGYDLITADYLAALERFVDAETGSTLVFSQGDVGSAEGPYEGRAPGGTNEILEDGTIKAWAHTGHPQAERFARILADKVIEGWKEAGRPNAPVPFTSTDVPVAMFDGWVPGPASHPYPAANACRTEDTIEGQPGVGTAADCTRGPKVTDQFDMAAESLREHGLPVPENYDMPAHMAVEENVRLHLQAVRLGEILLASCACEAQVDLILNIETRTDKEQGNIWHGFDWTEEDCTEQSDGTWTCKVGHNTVTGVPAQAVKKMLSQVHNDALGWDSLEYLPYANAEPADYAQIKGNFSHTELNADLGYDLTVGIGHAGDYNGYTVSYREFMSYDEYRKSLTSYGPHTADYMASRLMRMAEALKEDKGGRPYNPYTDEPMGAQAAADEARQTAVATSLGQIANAAYTGYDTAVADDLGEAGSVVAEPADIRRFNAAHFSWVGGNNWVDNPVVRIERKHGDGWQPYARQQGEIPVMIQWPSSQVGSQLWKWTATFEAFVGGPNERIGTTKEGVYRFVVEGKTRRGGKDVAYSATSREFRIDVWNQVPAPVTLTSDSASVPASFDYPKTYTGSPFRYIADDGRDNKTRPCATCSFRAWDNIGELASVMFTITDADGNVRREPGFKSGNSFVVTLAPGETATVAPGDAVDTHGNTNGAAA